jgi:hypothetical protein
MTQNKLWTSSALKFKIIKTDIHFQFKIILFNLFYSVFVVCCFCFKTPLCYSYSHDVFGHHYAQVSKNDINMT